MGDAGGQSLRNAMRPLTMPRNREPANVFPKRSPKKKSVRTSHPDAHRWFWTENEKGCYAPPR
jgi:hypothetical protein